MASSLSKSVDEVLSLDEDELIHWRAMYELEQLPHQIDRFNKFQLQSLRAISFSSLNFTTDKGKPDKKARDKAWKALLPDLP